MPRKTLPKTPESLFDPIESEGTSRTSSRGSSRSSTPTPRRSPRFSPKRNSNRNLPWYHRFLISSATFYTFLILTVLLILTVSRDFVSVSYCDGKEFIYPDCKECPPDATCSGTEFKCNEGAYAYKDICIIPGSPTEEAKNLIPKLEELIENQQVSKISDLRKFKEFELIPVKQIEIAVHLSDKYVLNDDKTFAPRTDNQSIHIILYIALAFCLMIFSLSVFFRRMK